MKRIFVFIGFCFFLFAFVACPPEFDNDKKKKNADAEAVATDKAALELSDIVLSSPDTSADSITQPFTVPITGENDTVITWDSTSDAVEFDNETGTVIIVRPENGDGDATITITATITKGGVSEKKSFTITIKEREAGVYYIYYFLNDGSNDAGNPTSYDGSARVILKAPTKDGYIFESWYTEATFENSVSDIPEGATGDKSFYAKWRQSIEPGQENQPGGLIEIPVLPAERAYWLAPAGTTAGNFVEGSNMTTADEEGLTSIAAPVTPGTYYLFFVVKTTQQILNTSANYITVLGDNVPFYYNGQIFMGFLETYNTDWLKVTVQNTDLLSDWTTVGSASFSNETHKAPTNLGSSETQPIVAVNKTNGDIWVLAHKTPSLAAYHYLALELWQYTSSSAVWTSKQVITYAGYDHSAFITMAMKNDASAMFISRTGWRSAGDWPALFEKRTGTGFDTSTIITGFQPSVVKIGGNYLYTLSQNNNFAAPNETDHTNMLSSHTGITIQRYDMSTNFEIANFTKIGGDYFNVSGATKYYAFKPEMYIAGDGTPFVVFVEPTTYEHARHNASGDWRLYGWNDKLTTPKLTVMKYNGISWVTVGANLFSPEVKRTRTEPALDGYSNTRAGSNYGTDADFTSTDAVFKPGICVAGTKVYVVGQDVDDKAFICEFNGTSWSTIKTNFATGVRDPLLVFDNGKLYITYTKADGSGVGYYTYTP